MLKTPLEDYVSDFPSKPLAFKIGFWAQVFGDDWLDTQHLMPLSTTEEYVQLDEGMNDAYWAQFTDSEPPGGYAE